jgi:ketosteroid isomerase-like protein
MGSESVEVVRRVYLAWQGGDLEELLSLVDREVSWSPVVRFLEGEARRRPSGASPVVSAGPDHLPEPTGRARELRGSRLSSARARTAPRRQPVQEGDLDVRVSWVWTVRAGRVVAMKAFLEEREARAEIA